MQAKPQSAVSRIKAALGQHPQLPVPRAELWLGSELFERAGLTDTVANHFRLAEQLGQDMVCLPVTGDPAHVPNLGYRYFEIDDLEHLTRHGDGFVAAVVDGPFQALVNQKGLMDVLMGWVRQRQELVAAYAVIHAQTVELIKRCLAGGVHGIVIADDLSADRGPLISPADIETLCGAFYLEAVQTIHSAAGAVLVHCCGDVHPLAPFYKKWGIDGLAAVQHRTNDLVALKKTWGSHLLIMAGIDAELLETDPPMASAMTSFERLVRDLAPQGGLIIGSSCGLYRGEFLSRIKALYDHMDALI
jgi:hypothetical protein